MGRVDTVRRVGGQARSARGTAAKIRSPRRDVAEPAAGSSFSITDTDAHSRRRCQRPVDITDLCSGSDAAAPARVRHVAPRTRTAPVRRSSRRPRTSPSAGPRALRSRSPGRSGAEVYRAESPSARACTRRQLDRDGIACVADRRQSSSAAVRRAIRCGRGDRTKISSVSRAGPDRGLGPRGDWSSSRNVAGGSLRPIRACAITRGPAQPVFETSAAGRSVTRLRAAPRVVAASGQVVIVVRRSTSRRSLRSIARRRPLAQAKPVVPLSPSSSTTRSARHERRARLHGASCGSSVAFARTPHSGPRGRAPLSAARVTSRVGKEVWRGTKRGLDDAHRTNTRSLGGAVWTAPRAPAVGPSSLRDRRRRDRRSDRPKLAQQREVFATVCRRRTAPAHGDPPAGAAVHPVATGVRRPVRPSRGERVVVSTSTRRIRSSTSAGIHKGRTRTCGVEYVSSSEHDLHPGAAAPPPRPTADPDRARGPDRGGGAQPAPHWAVGTPALTLLSTTTPPFRRACRVRPILVALRVFWLPPERSESDSEPVATSRTCALLPDAALVATPPRSCASCPSARASGPASRRRRRAP